MLPISVFSPSMAFTLWAKHVQIIYPDDLTGMGGHAGLEPGGV